MLTPNFIAVGTDVATTTTTLALVAPTCQVGDAIFAIIVSKNNTALTVPTDWTIIQDVSNTAAMRTAIAWKKIGSADSGATFNFTVAGTTVSYGCLVVFRNVQQVGASSASANALADNVTYATITPDPNSVVVGFGSYSLNATTLGAMTGTDPTFANILDVETASGTTASLFASWGPSLDGAATGARTQPSNSTTDAVNQGFFVELRPMDDVGGGVISSSAAKYPAVIRQRTR